MTDVLKMSRKALTMAVVFTTILWSVMAVFMVPKASAAGCTSGTNIKGSLSSVYFCGGDGKRYVYPNEKTYKTWFADFTGVVTLSDADLAAIQIGGNVTYRPGVKMVKITTDPKVYAVDKGGVLHPIASEAVASALYGSTWNKMIDDVPDAFFTNYTVGSAINAASDYDKNAVMSGDQTINADKNLGGGGVVSGALVASLASFTPAASSIPKNAYGVTMLKVDVRNGGSTASTVDSLTVQRVGAGAPADFANVYVYDGNNRLTTGRTINSSNNQATFGGLNLALAAGETKTLVITADFAGGTINGNQDALQVVALTAGSVTASGLPLTGPYFTLTNATVSSVTVDPGATPSSVKAGQLGGKVAEFKLTNNSSSEDVLVSKVVLFYTGSTSRSNLTNFSLKQNSVVQSTVAGISDKDLVTFVLSTPYLLQKGYVKTFEVFADLNGAARSTDNIKFNLDQTTDVLAVGTVYNAGVAITNNYNTAVTVTIEAGKLTTSFSGPSSSDVAANSKQVMLYSYSMAAASNLEVKKTYFRVVSSVDHVYDAIENFKLLDADTGAIVAGPATIADDTNTTKDFTFTETYTLTAGSTRHFKVVADVKSGATDGGTITVTLGDVANTRLFAPSADIRNLDNSTYLVAADMVPAGVIAGNAMTIKKASLTMSGAASPVSQTIIQGTAGVPLLGISLKAGTASDVKITSLAVTGYIGATADVFPLTAGASGTAVVSNEVLTVKLMQGSTPLGATKSPDSTTGKATFDNLSLVIPKGQVITLTLVGNLAASISNLPDTISFDIAANGDVAAQDADNNSLTAGTNLTGAAFNGTVNPTVRMKVTAGGAVTVAKAPDDSESEAGMVIENSNAVLAKYRFSATDEELKLTKARIAVASSTAIINVSLYDGATLVGGPIGVDGNGFADFSGLNFVIPKDGSKTLTVKGQVNLVGSAGVATGASAKVTLTSATAGTFEIRGTSAGSSTVLTTFTASPLAGNEKIVRNTKPTVSLAALPQSILQATTVVAMRFTVTADANDNVALRKLSFNTTSSSVNALTVSIDGLRRVGDSVNLSATTSPFSCFGAALNCTSIIGLTADEVIAAGTSRTYDLRLTVSGTLSTGDTLTTKLLGDTTNHTSALSGTAPLYGVGGVAENFIWSDNSAAGHGDLTLDWTNSNYVKVLPSDPQTLTK